MRKPLHEFFFEKVKKYGYIFGIYGIGNRVLIVNDPKIAREISIKESHKFSIRWWGYLGSTSVIHSLLLMPANDDWKRIRAIVTPAFTSGKLKAMITPINKILKNFVRNLKKHSESGEIFDVSIYTGALTMDVIALCSYGIEVDSISESNHPLVKHAKRIMDWDSSWSLGICVIIPFLGRFLNLEPIDFESAKYFDNLTFKIIKERLKTKNQGKKDLIGLMVEQTLNDQSESNGIDTNGRKLKGISQEEIAGQGIVFLLAGYDTTNVTLCHVIYYLVKHLEWQDKLYEELITHDSALDYEALRNLPILNGIICETLRLKPAVNLVPRVADKDTMLLNTGIKIPAKTAIIFSPYIMHRIPEYFPDPESFKPERFIGENSMESSIAYMPYGIGNRLCVGMRFAQNELRAAVAQLILNYRLISDKDLKLDYLKGNFILSPKQVMIQIAKRIKACPGPHFRWMRKPLHEYFHEEVKKYGYIFGMYGIGNRVLVLNDPKIVREMSIKELHKFPNRWWGYFGKTSVIYSVLLMPANDDWKRIRTIVTPAFTSGKLKAMITPIHTILNNFVRNLERHSKSGEIFNVKIYTGALTMDIIGACAYGIEVDSISESNHPLVKHAQRIMNWDSSWSFAICVAIPFLGKFLDLDPIDRESAKYFDDLTFKIIEERLKTKNQQKKDLIGLMVEQTLNDQSESNGIDKNEQKLKGISREEIAGQGIVFLLAGYDTTNATLCHVIYYLVKHPEWQDKLYNELITHDSPLNYESLRSLPILNGVICETLRLKPAVILVPRAPAKSATLLNTGIEIPAKTLILFSPYIMHRIPEYFPDPESFKPERFIGENSMESSIAYMPFGTGSRLCVGNRFALNELRAAIAQLILNYRLIPNTNLKLEYLKGNFILSPKQLLSVKYFRYYTFWQRQGIIARSGPDFGWMRKPLHEFVHEQVKKYGYIFGVYGIGQRALIFNDPKMVRELSIKELHKFPIRFGGYMGKTSMIHSALTMDVIASCAYGIEVDSISESNHPLVKHAQRILSLDVSLNQAICFVFPFLGKFLNLDPFDRESAKYFDDLTFKIIEERLKTKNKQSKDLIGLMVEQTVNDQSESNGIDKNEQKLKGISREEIAGQGIIFFLAGYDTTNVTLCHIIYYLIKHPEWQDKLYEELSITDSSLDYESLRNLPILNGIICETLRLKPPLVSVQRTAARDTTLLNTGIKIPAEVSIIFHPYIMHRMPEYFPDPESFKPERFIGENSMESSIAYMPFGTGNRLCVGMRFAQNELRAAVAQLILHYRLIPDHDLKLDYFKGNVILSPKQVMIRIAKR
ncbi:hypothetical protein DERP_006895, partial [Dermatophagoides pteronyssinus]